MTATYPWTVSCLEHGIARLMPMYLRTLYLARLACCPNGSSVTHKRHFFGFFRYILFYFVFFSNGVNFKSAHVFWLTPIDLDLIVFVLEVYPIERGENLLSLGTLNRVLFVCFFLFFCIILLVNICADTPLLWFKNFSSVSFALNNHARIRCGDR